MAYRHWRPLVCRDGLGSRQLTGMILNVCDSCLQDFTSSSLVSHQSATLTNRKEFKDCLEHVTEYFFCDALHPTEF